VESPALAEAGVENVDALTDADWAQLRRSSGDQRMLGMSLDAGGHLTHGFRPTISGKMFEQSSYGTDPVTAEGDWKVRYRLDPQVAERVRARAADLVGAHPLYPEIDLADRG